MKSTGNGLNKLANLIALKRYEKPPPTYFSRFSRNVIQRIQSGEPDDAPTGFWGRVLDVLVSRPVLAGAYTVAVCGALLFGLSVSQIVGEKMADIPFEHELTARIALPPPSTTGMWTTTNLAAALQAASSSFSPIIRVEPSQGLFESRMPKAQPVSLQTNGD